MVGHVHPDKRHRELFLQSEAKFSRTRWWEWNVWVLPIQPERLTFWRTPQLTKKAFYIPIRLTEMHCFCDDGSKVYSWLETAIMEEKLVLFLDTWSYTTSLSATTETGNWRRHISVTLKLFSCIAKHIQTNKHAAVLHVHQRRKKRQCGMHLWVGPETASSL